MGSIQSASFFQSGVGVGAAINVDNQMRANRSDVEDWLREMDAFAKAKEESRHAQMMSVARWTLVVALVAAVAGIMAAWPVVQGWLR